MIMPAMLSRKPWTVASILRFDVSERMVSPNESKDFIRSVVRRTDSIFIKKPPIG